jgi:choice-of-anchor B domain-containing protein
MRTVLISLCIPALTLAAAAQNATLLGRLDTRVAYAGVWGYTAADGREYAIVGERTGTMVVDCTDPRNPTEIAYFTAPSSTWREITSLGPIVYSCSENHGGIRLIDMTNPGAPQDLGYRFQTGAVVWNNTHSISADPDLKRILCNGTSGGMRILDASADPRNPTYLGSYTTAYVHDSYWRRGKGYLAHINAGTARIVNAQNATNMTTISNTQTPGRFTHNIWVTEDDLLMLTTDENSTGYLQAYDITNAAAPAARGSYVVSGAIVHNVFGIGRTAYIAHYTDGFHVVDLADPMSLKMVARYDTSTSGSGYNGAWGAYPWTDNGICYVSDIQNGLYCLQIDVGHINRYGNGVAGNNGVPRAYAEGGAIEVGQGALKLVTQNLVANQPWLLVIGSSQGTGSVLGIPIHVNLNGAILLSGTADGNGNATIPLPIPGNASLANQKIYLQLVSISGGSLTSSRGMWAGIGAQT